MEKAHVVIPQMPELVMTGVTKQLTIRVLECAGGGFIVVFDGHGMAARSSWGEVLDSVEDAGCEHLGLDRPERIPRGIMPDHNEKSLRIREKVEDRIHTIAAFALTLAAALAAAALSAMSVRIA